MSSRYPRRTAPRTGHEARRLQGCLQEEKTREADAGPLRRGAGRGTGFRTRRQGYLRRVFGYFLHRKYPDFRSSLEIFFQLS